jgi:hypothetical protein
MRLFSKGRACRRARACPFTPLEPTRARAPRRPRPELRRAPRRTFCFFMSMLEKKWEMEGSARIFS